MSEPRLDPSQGVPGPLVDIAQVALHRFNDPAAYREIARWLLSDVGATTVALLPRSDLEPWVTIQEDMRPDLDCLLGSKTLLTTSTAWIVESAGPTASDAWRLVQDLNVERGTSVGALVVIVPAGVQLALDQLNLVEDMARSLALMLRRSELFLKAYAERKTGTV